MEYIRIDENRLHIVFGVTKEHQLKLLHFSSATFDEANLCKEEYMIKEAFQPVQVSFSGYNRPYEKHGNKHIVTAPGYMLQYVGMEDNRNEIGRHLVFTQEDDVTGARVISDWQFYGDTDIVRMQNTVINTGK